MEELIELFSGNIEEVIERWTNIGFLDGLKDEEQIKCVAASCEIAAKYFTSDESQHAIFGEKEYVDLNSMVFPVLRRTIVKNSDGFKYDIKKIEIFTLDLINDLNTKLNSVDFQAEYLSRYSDNFDVKKYFE